MTRNFWRVGTLVMVMFAISAAAALAQDRPEAAPVPQHLRFSVEGTAGFQVYYTGSMQSIAFGFAPTRKLTLVVNLERSYVADEIDFYPDGYASERGGTEQFVSGEVRYAFLPNKRLTPYVLGGMGGGISRPNVNEFFPDKRERNIQVIYYGGGARIPAGSRLDAFVDLRLIMSTEARSDYFAVHMPLRAGIACRF